ncbi:MAG: hypothetical protein MI892_02905 [Desulfobacterales bacterium]|nr:hypothetical protein [Desulfobacterales bacterium]
MVIVTNISYPPESAKDMATRFLEAPQLPDYVTRRGPYINATTDDGIITLSIYELDNAKLAEGSQFIGDYMATFFGVSGFKYQMRPFFEIDEALKMIGMG